MKKRKLFILILLITMLFSACAREKIPVIPKENIVFTIWIDTGTIEKEMIESAWEDFVPQVPDFQDKEVQLKIHSYDLLPEFFSEAKILQYAQKINSEVPDLIIVDDYCTWILGASNQLVDLTTMGADAYENEFYKSVWELGKTDTALYGMPFCIDTTIYSGKKDEMTASHVQMPQSWQEMLETGATLQEDVNGDVFKEMWYCPKVSMGSDSSGAILSWIWRLGGDLVTVDGTNTALNENNALTKAFTMMQELKQKELLVGDAENTGYHDAYEGVFSALNCYWLSYNSEERNYGLMPQLEENIPRYALKYGCCVSIPNDSKQQSIAYEFLQHLVFGSDSQTGKAYQLYNTDIAMPAQKDLFSKTGLSEEVLEIYTQQLSIAKVLPRVEGVSYCLDLLYTSLCDVLYSGKEPDQAAEEADAQIRYFLQKVS